MVDVLTSRLFNNALIRLPGATMAVMQQELFMAVDDFLKDTNAWQEDIPLTIPGSQPPGTIYVLAPQAPSAITRLMWVFSAPASTGAMRGSQVGASMSVPGELILSLQPSAVLNIIATVALTVLDPVNKENNVIYPAWILQKYHDVLLDGLLGRMMMQPNKPWSNTQMTVYHTRRFNSGKAKARVEVTHNNTYRQQAWRFPQFAGGTQRGRSSSWAPPQ